MSTRTAPSPSVAVLRTEARLFSREAGALFWIIAFPTVLFGIFAAIPSFREADESLGGQSVAELYVPVTVLLSMIMASIQAMPPVLSGYRERGILRRLQATPVHPGSLLLAQVVMHAMAVVIGAALVLGVSRIAIGAPLPQQVPGYALSFVLALASCFAVGSTITAVSATARVTTTVGTIVFFPLMFTAGVWLPVQSMPDLMQKIVVLTPLGAGAEALNDSALGQWPDLADLAVMAGWTGVLAFVAVRWFRWE